MLAQDGKYETRRRDFPSSELPAEKDEMISVLRGFACDPDFRSRGLVHLGGSMTSSIDEWVGVKARLVIGTTVSGVVVHHRPFGFFVTIENTAAIGLIERVRMTQDGYSTPTDDPRIGERITATVLGFRDYSRQVELALPRKQIVQEEASKVEYNGMTDVEN